MRRAGPDWALREGRTLAGPFPEEDEDAGQSDAEPVGAPVPPAPGGPPGGPWLDDAWGPPPACEDGGAGPAGGVCVSHHQAGAATGTRGPRLVSLYGPGLGLSGVSPSRRCCLLGQDHY